MRTSWDLRNGCPSGLAETLAERLKGGEVGLLPTETVYGIMASSAQPAACARIYAIKGRESSKLLPYMTARPLLALGDAPGSRVAAKLARLLWPGPLTLVLGPGHGRAWRIPDHVLLHDMLRQLSEPVVATSANRSGMSAPAAAEAIDPALLSAVDFAVLDAPGTGCASTIVRVGAHESLEFLRHGGISEARIRTLAAYRVEIICTGNTCRSPMAAAILSRELEGIGNIVVQSCGTSADPGAPASEGAIKAAASLGLDLRTHQSRGLPADLHESDLILCMAAHHRESVLSRSLALGGPSLELMSPAGKAVPDPWGGSSSDYDFVAAELLALLKPWADHIRRQISSA